MEPQIHIQEKGLAPLVGWSSFTSSLDPSPNRSFEIDHSQRNFLKNPKKSQRSFRRQTSCNETKERLLSQGKNDLNTTIKENHVNKNNHNQKSKIPDGGWGWVIVFSSFIMSMIADGICFTFGLLYVEFLEEFGASNSVTSWIGSLFVSVPLLTGPIMSALVDHYGCRSMTIVGGIISAIGFFLSSYAESIVVMYITFGIIAGLGLGLCFVTAVVSIAYWFDKKRTLAIGLGACGTGVGTFVYAPLTQFLIEELGWRGSMMILAGTLLNICVCGTLMREPKWLLKEQNRENSRGSKRSSNAHLSSRKSDVDGDFPGVEEIRKLLRKAEKPEYILQTLATYMQTPSDNAPAARLSSRSVVSLPTFIKKSEKVPLEVLEQLSANKRLYNVVLENYPSLLSYRSMSEKSLNTVVDESAPFPSRVPVTMTMKLKVAQKEVPVKKKWYKKFVELLKGIFDFSLFLEFHFFLMSLSTMLLFVWFIVPYFYLVEHLQRNHYSDSEASVAISVLGASNFVGMIGLGWAGDRPWMNILKAYAVCLIICGISCIAIMVFTQNYIMVLVSSASFGLSFSSTYSFTPAILVELISLENFTYAYGLILLCQGIGHLIGPPIAGYIFDVTNTWEQTFWQAGIWIIVSGILIIFIPYTKNRKMFGKQLLDDTDVDT